MESGHLIAIASGDWFGLRLSGNRCPGLVSTPKILPALSSDTSGNSTGPRRIRPNPTHSATNSDRCRPFALSADSEDRDRARFTVVFISDACMVTRDLPRTLKVRNAGHQPRSQERGLFPAFPVVTGSGSDFLGNSVRERWAHRKSFQLSPATRAKTRRDRGGYALIQPTRQPTPIAADLSRSPPTPTAPIVLASPWSLQRMLAWSRASCPERLRMSHAGPWRGR